MCPAQPHRGPLLVKIPEGITELGLLAWPGGYHTLVPFFAVRITLGGKERC